MNELEQEELELALYLKKHGFFATKGANAIVSFNSDGSEVKLKYELYPPAFRRKFAIKP